MHAINSSLLSTGYGALVAVTPRDHATRHAAPPTACVVEMDGEGGWSVLRDERKRAEVAGGVAAVGVARFATDALPPGGTVLFFGDAARVVE